MNLSIFFDDDYLEFKQYCIERYGINNKDPNYEELQKIEDKYIKFN